MDQQNRQITAAKTENTLITNQSPGNPYLIAATANNTRKAYRTDIAHFQNWGGMLPTTPQVLVEYLNVFASHLKPITLSRRLTAIKHWHTYQGFSDPTQSPLVRKTLKGIAHVHGTPAKKAPPLTIPQLETIARHLMEQTTLMALRDNALLQLGFFGAFRRSELIAICCEHISENNDGLLIKIPRSKTDPDGKGLECAIPHHKIDAVLSPVYALKQWLTAANITEGPLFRKITRWQTLSQDALTPVSVNLIIKKYAAQFHFPNADLFSGHSLRRGLATSASQKNVPIKTIMRQGRWRHVNTVMQYVDDSQIFEENAAGMLMDQSK